MLRPAHHGFYEIAVVEFDLKWQLDEIGGGEIKGCLRQVDAVIVADLGSGSAAFIVLASPQAMSRKRCLTSSAGNRPDCEAVQMADKASTGILRMIERGQRAQRDAREPRLQIMKP